MTQALTRTTLPCAAFLSVLTACLLAGSAVPLWAAPARQAAPVSSASPEPSASKRPDPADPAAPATNPVAAAQQPTETEELRRRIDVLAAEVDRLRSGEEEQAELTETRRRALGLGPSAAATYRRRRGVSIAGYGEMLYENFDQQLQSGVGSRKAAQLDLLRAVLYFGYRFSDKFVFNSEIELEHANEISVEFAYLDYLVSDRMTVRAGMLLLPLGLVNEFHEPNVFLGARRPETETRIIPSTWRENGVGILGSAGRFTYRAYLVNGFNAAGFSADGLRGGRQKGSRALAAELAFTGRLDFAPTAGVFVGGGLYAGGSGQEQFQLNGRVLDVGTTIGETHGQIQIRGFDVRALYARATLDEVAELNAVRSLSGTRSIGETLEGGYLQVGYNVLSQFTDRVGLTPYYRLERVNTQARVPTAFSADPVREGTFHTVGFEFRPIYNVVVKTDYQTNRNAGRTGRNQFNVGLGYAF